MPVHTVSKALRGASNKNVLALLALGIVLLITAIVTAVVTMVSISEDTDAVETTLKVETALNHISALNEQVETGRRGYLIGGDPVFRTITVQADDDVRAEIEALQPLLADNPSQITRAAHLLYLAEKRHTIVEALMALPPERLSDTAAEQFDRDPGVLLMRQIRATTLEMLAEEQQLLSERNKSQLTSLKTFYAVGGVALILLLGVMGTVIFAMIRFNRALSLAETELRHANEGLEGAVATRTTELRLANAEIQRFAYIVSHDLRSPLVNVLGFTSELEAAAKIIRAHLADLREKQPELVTQDLSYAVDEDLPEALGFIRTSTEKMDRLINSILELSRQGRRTLKPEKLDMSELVQNAADTLYQRAQEEGAVVTVEELPKVESDRMAIEQIMANLLENAIKYLDPNRTGDIRVTGERSFGQVHYDVIDNGRGIDPADHERVFDLFRRSGKQDKAGEGIGLANVRALAHRLGGTVTIDSELDRGATFRLSLPTKFRPVEEAI